MGDTDTKVLDIMVPGTDPAVSNTGLGIESSRYRKPHPLFVIIIIIPHPFNFIIN